MKIVNKKIAVIPPVSNSIKVQTKHGLAVIQQQLYLLPLQVLFENASGYSVGSIIMVRGESTHHTWAKEVFEYEGIRFVLCPEEQVVAVNSIDLSIKDQIKDVAKKIVEDAEKKGLL